MNSTIEKKNVSTLKVNTSLLKEYGIDAGDYISVSHTICDYNGKVLVVQMGGKLIIRKASLKGNRITLYAGNLSPMEFHISETSIYGWVQYIIHPL